jgi:hypothetical protein
VANVSVASPVQILYNTTQPNGPQQALFQSAQLQRSSLLLVGDRVPHGCSPLNPPTCALYESLVVAFGNGTTETSSKYQGWAFAFDANPSDPTYLTTNYNQNTNGGVANALPYITQCEYPPEGNATYRPGCTTPSQTDSQLANSCGQGGGVWMASRAPSANIYGQVFYDAGNGGFSYCYNCANHCAVQPPGNFAWQNFTNFGEAVLHTNMDLVWTAKTTTSSPVQAPFLPIDYFVPYVPPLAVQNTSIVNDCGTDGTTGPPCANYLQALNAHDLDMGVSGTLLFDDYWFNLSSCPQSQDYICANTSLLLTSTKRGDGYVLAQSALGQYLNNDGGMVNRFDISSGAASGGANPTCSLQANTPPSQGGPQYFCDEPRAPAYWNPNAPSAGNGFLVVWPWYENLASFQWENQGLLTQYNFTAPPNDPQGGKTSNPFAGIKLTNVPPTVPPAPNPATTGYAGGALMLTVNPTLEPDAAVVWAVAEPYPNIAGSNYGSPCNGVAGIFCLGYLFAYKLDGTTGALTQIWPSTLPTNTTVPDFASTPFASPTAAHGHVYIPTFSLCSSFTGGSCTGASYTLAGVQAYSFPTQ